MEIYCNLLRNNHDYINYECILSVSELPYLVGMYGCKCFKDTLNIADEEYMKIDMILHSFYIKF